MAQITYMLHDTSMLEVRFMVLEMECKHSMNVECCGSCLFLLPYI